MENEVISWNHTLKRTNGEPYYQLTIPKVVWSKLPVLLEHKQKNFFIQGNDRRIYYLSIKKEKGGKIKAVGDGWKEMLVARDYKVGEQFKFTFTHFVAKERGIKVARM